MNGHGQEAELDRPFALRATDLREIRAGLLRHFKAAKSEFARAGARLMADVRHEQALFRSKYGRESSVHQVAFALAQALKRRVEEWDDVLVVEPAAAFEFATLATLALVPEVKPEELGVARLEPWESKRWRGDDDASKTWNVHGMIADYADLTASSSIADLNERSRRLAARFREICISVIDQLEVLASVDVPVAPTKMVNHACWRAWLNKQLAEQSCPDAEGLRDLFNWLNDGHWQGYLTGKNPPNWESFRSYVGRVRRAVDGGDEPPMDLIAEVLGGSGLEVDPRRKSQLA